MGRRKSKSSSWGSSRWKIATSCWRNRRCWKQRSSSVRLDEQVGNDDDQRPLARSSRPARAAPDELGLALRLGLLRARRRRPSGATDCAAAGCCARSRRPRTTARPRLPAELARWPSVPAIRRAYSILVTPREPKPIEPLVSTHQAAAQVGVGLELLDEEPVRAPVGPPIEPPQIVAGHVLAILGELDARAAVRAGMPARNGSLHRPPREQREPRQSRQDARSRKLRDGDRETCRRCPCDAVARSLPGRR